MSLTLAGDNALLDADIPYAKRKEILARRAEQLIDRNVPRIMTADNMRLISSRSLSEDQKTLF